MRTLSWSKCFFLFLTSYFPKFICGNICYMMYSMEDNNLEYFLRQDIEEYIRSKAIKDTTVTSWVYIDARNIDGGYDDINEPLSNIYYSDGSNVTGTKYEGSYYLTYNHNLQKMIINTTLLQEQNSDESAVVQQFLQYALTDCIRRGSTEYFAVFSSHGGGFAGYGGDETDSRRRYERLRRGRYLQAEEVQSNQNLTSAITGALAAVSGAPSKLNVLAFDACLMSDFGALDEFRAAADYVLASEATEPGHGFAYYTLDQTDSALELAKDMYDGYLTETQAQAYADLTGFVDDVHQIPKTLAIINTTAFTTFLKAWDSLSAELTNLLDTNNDSTLFTVLSRARSITLSFSGYLDGSSSQTPSLVDIGQFLNNFISLCSIDPSSQLATLVTSAQKAYRNMYVVQGVGPGTANATGMVILWPYQRAYDDDPSVYDEYLFDTSDIYATKDAPNWLTFLKLFYNSSISQSDDTSTSVCRTSIDPTFQQTYEGQMILGPQVNFTESTNSLLFSAQAALETDYIAVSYGINFTSKMNSNRRLQNKVRHLASRSKNVNNKSFRHVRRTQDSSGNYYYIYGGRMQVEYAGALVEAEWDRYYYLMNATDNFEVLYITDKGNGQKSFPVCYFSPVYPISSTDLEGIVDLTTAILDLGCIQGEMVFLMTEDGSYSLSLYAYDPIFSTYREVPSFSGGQIAPVTYVDLSINGASVTNIVGGFAETIIDWSPFTSFGILQLSDAMNMVLFDAPTGLVVASAFDFDNFDLFFGTGYDVYIYEYVIMTNTTGDGDGQNSSGSTGNNTQGGNGSGTVGNGTDQNSSGSTGNQTQGGNGSGQNSSGSTGDGTQGDNGSGTTSDGAGQNSSGSAGDSGSPGQSSSSRLSVSFTWSSAVNCNIGLSLGFLTFVLM